MAQIYGISEVWRELRDEMGAGFLPRHVSDAIYQDADLSARCPCISGRRVIPADVLPELRRVLQAKRSRNRKVAG